MPARGPDMKRIEESTDAPELPAASPAPAASPEASSVSPAAASPAGPRVIARIVDPLVREDGRGDPQLILRTDARPSGGSSLASRASHPVRDRLLAKARVASHAAGQAPIESPSEPDATPLEPSEPELGFKALSELADDLDLIGAPERRRTRAPEPAAPALTSAAALLLGTLFGVTLMAVLFASLIQLAPHDAVTPGAPLPKQAVVAPQVEQALTPKPGPNVRRPPRRRVEGPWRIARAELDVSSKRVMGSVGANSFLAALQGAGIHLREAYRVLTAFNGVKDLNRCRPNDTFSALTDASGRLTAFEYIVSDEEVYQAREGKDGLLIGQKLDLSVRRDRVQGVIVVDGELDAAALEAGFEPGLGDVLDKALAGYSSVAELKRGDVLALVVQEVTVLGEFSRYAGVEALEYRPVGAEPVRIYYHETEKSRGYVDSKGRVFGKSRWSRPVPGAAVTSRFNPKRLHPILKRIKPHNGTDFGAPIGTPVVAAGSGKVLFVGPAGPNGNMITLAHSGGYQTGYSHLSRFAKGLKVGDRVEQKQLIGYVGNTGRSTGPHLHFSAKKGSRFIDPESLNLDAFSRLAVSDRELLTELRQRYDRLLSSLPIPEPRAPAAEPHESEPFNPAPAATVQAALRPRASTGAVGAAPALSIYLTDQELIQRQPNTHDGEVEP